MGDFVANSALGAVKQLVANVENNSPAAAVLRMHVWNRGAAVDDDMNNADTIAEFEAVTGVAEVTNSGYANIVMDETDITITIDDTNNRVDCICGDQSFTGIGAGDAWTDITYSYDAAGTDTDSGTLILSNHTFAVTPNDGDITTNEGASGFYRAQ